MKVAFFSNFLNHHQVAFSDEMYKLLGGDYAFVATLPPDQEKLKGGGDYSRKRPYCICAYEGGENLIRAHVIALDYDVVLLGGDSMPFALTRSRTDKLTFEVAERWLKRGWRSLLSPRLLKWQWYYHTRYAHLPWYKLCSGAFAASDDARMFTYRNRCFRWGYFTKVEKFDSKRVSSGTGIVPRLIWCGRMIDWKHPEAAVFLAERLKDGHYHFHIDMYGDGVLLPQMKRLVRDLDLNSEVTFHGPVTNDVVNDAMRTGHLALLTSDRREGWGVVANEALSNGCLLVGSDEAGSVPYLIENGISGMVFRSRDWDDLFITVRKLLDDRAACEGIAENGYNRILNEWSPRTAAGRLVSLCDALLHDGSTPFLTGPCSEA